MNIITVSREFGSGGRELGKRLAELLGYDYYDKEIISEIAQNRGMSADYVKSMLENHGWHNYPLTFHRSFVPNTFYIQTEFLLEQKKVIEKIASLGNDFVIVGRSADILLREYKPFNIFVYADIESKIRRCKERADSNEKVSEKEIIRKMKEIDKTRSRTRAIIGSAAWGDKINYHLLINTSGQNMKEISGAVKSFYTDFHGRSE